MAREDAVVLFVQKPGWMFCDRTESLREKGVASTTRNEAEDEGALAELERIETLTTPVAVIGSGAGDEVVVGFDRARLLRVLSS